MQNLQFQYTHLLRTGPEILFYNTAYTNSNGNKRSQNNPQSFLRTQAICTETDQFLTKAEKCEGPDQRNFAETCNFHTIFNYSIHENSYIQHNKTI